MSITRLYSFFGVLIISMHFVGCSTFNNFVSEDMSSNTDFREVKWGYSQARVMLIEQGKAVFQRSPDLLVYKSIIDQVPLYLVYSFRDNKLRASGYITQKPTTNAQNLVQKSLDKLGEPSYDLTNGKLWELPRSIVYVDGYSTHTRARTSSHQQASGALELILKVKPEETEITTRWDGVVAYIDRNYYRQLSEIEHPLLDLSYYEKRLFGILRRRETTSIRTSTGTTITIPSQEITDR